MNVEIVPGKEKEIAEKVIAIKEKADAIQVIDQESYDAADALNNAARNEKKAFHEFFDPIDDSSKKQRQAVIAQGKAIDEPLDYVIKVTAQKQGAWFRAEQARKAEEKRVAEEAERKSAEDARLKEAEELSAAGLTEAADAVLEAPVVIKKVEVDEPVKAPGTSYRTNYSAECVSIIELARAVAAREAPESLLMLNQIVANGLARATKGTVSVRGLRIVTTFVQAKRR